MTTPSALDVARRALELCDEHPGRTAGCNYLQYDVDDDITGPNCIYGTALVDLGVDPDWLRQHEGSSIEAVLELLIGFPYTLTDLGAAQANQDDGLPWGSEDVRGKIARFVQVNS